jgi:hypothetical protein
MHRGIALLRSVATYMKRGENQRQSARGKTEKSTCSLRRHDGLVLLTNKTKTRFVRSAKRER